MIYCLCSETKTPMDTIEDEWERTIVQCPKCKSKVEESG